MHIMNRVRVTNYTTGYGASGKTARLLTIVYSNDIHIYNYIQQ